MCVCVYCLLWTRFTVIFSVSFYVSLVCFEWRCCLGLWVCVCVRICVWSITTNKNVSWMCRSLCVGPPVTLCYRHRPSIFRRLSSKKYQICLFTNLVLKMDFVCFFFFWFLILIDFFVFFSFVVNITLNYLYINDKNFQNIKSRNKCLIHFLWFSLTFSSLFLSLSLFLCFILPTHQIKKK